jgi:poly(A) polymerase
MSLPTPVPLTDPQRRAVAALLRKVAPAAGELGRVFAAHGHELALVGGSVRDVFLSRRSDDVDLATDAAPERVLEITGDWADKVWLIGIEFGTVGLRKDGCTFEITAYRSESYGPKSRKPAVRYGTSLEEDLARRDFTINAMAARLPVAGVDDLVDPFGGLRDLREGVLRTPSSPSGSFGDDPVRMLRAARFAAQLGFSVAPEVREAMTAMARRIEIVSPERIRAELAKLMVAPGPRTGIELLTDTGLAAYVLPEVPKLKLETDEHHRHKDVYEHSLTVLTQAAELEERYGLSADLVVRFAALLHDIGKPKTRTLLPGGRVAFHQHEVAGAAMARARLRELRFPKSIVDDVARLVELHLRFHGYGTGEWTDSAVRRYVRDAGPLLSRLHVLTRADCTTRNKARASRLASGYDALEQRIARLAKKEELAKIRPDLDGHEIMRVLGLRSGPAVGEASRFLLDLRMEHGPLGRQRATAELLRWAREHGITPPAAGPNPDP